MKRVADEEGAIAFFNAVNKCKPQLWKVDPTLLVNKYVAALTKRFNGSKKVLLIRPGATHRPYLSSDKMRDALLLYSKDLKQSSEDVRAFVDRVVRWNTQEVGVSQMTLSLDKVPKKEIGILEKSIEMGFILAFDGTFRWIHACLA